MNGKLPHWVRHNKPGTFPVNGLTFAGLFCGCGGMDLGAKLAGFTGVYSADMDSVAVDTFKNNISNEVEVTDLCNSEIPNYVSGVDLLLGGPPCQGFSSAGPKQENDPRNKLWRHYLEYVRRWSPKVFLLENVPGFMREFSGFSKVIESELGGIYKLHCKRFIAQFYGTPQFRDRVIIQGVRKDLSPLACWPIPTINEFFDYTRSFDSAISMQEALQDLGPAQPYSMHSTTDHAYIPLNIKDAGIAIHIPNGGSLKDIPDTMLPEPYTGRTRTNGGWTWYYRKPRPELPGRSVIASIRPNYATIIAPDVNCNQVDSHWIWEAINAPDYTDCKGYYTSPVPPRRLTIRECARLQTFPDWFRFSGNPLQQHRQIGNAVPVELARRLCESAAQLILTGGATAHPVGQLDLF